MIPLSSLILQVNFSMLDVTLLLSIVVLLVISAFSSACEMAYSSASLIRVRNYVDEKKRGARKALWIMEHFDKALATILVLNNFVNIASTTICAVVFGRLIVDPTLANVLNTVIMTIIILVFGEILPKSLAKARWDKLVLSFSGALFTIIKILTPIIYPFYKLQSTLLSRVKEGNPTVTEDELGSIIDTMEEEGVLNSEDADLFQGVRALDSQDAYDIMTPRVDVAAIDVSEGTKELQKMFVETGFSRIPVYKDDKDHIVGIVHIKDYFNKFDSGEEFAIEDLLTEPVFISENMKVNDLIRKLQLEKKHMAIVIDEHGGTSGIITLEDAMEEMLGDIYDEHDDEVVGSYITKIDENVYDVNPDIDLDDLFEGLKIEQMPDTEYTTLGGFLYELSENLPEKDQQLEVITVDEQMDNSGGIIEKTVKLTFIITEIEDRSIEKVKLIVEPSADVQPKIHLRRVRAKGDEVKAEQKTVSVEQELDKLDDKENLKDASEDDSDAKDNRMLNDLNLKNLDNDRHKPKNKSDKKND